MHTLPKWCSLPPYKGAVKLTKKVHPTTLKWFCTLYLNSAPYHLNKDIPYQDSAPYPKTHLIKTVHLTTLTKSTP